MFGRRGSDKLLPTWHPYDDEVAENGGVKYLINSCHRFRGETKLEPADRIKIETEPSNGDVTSTLTVEALKLDDKGDIKAVGKNPAGETSAAAKLNVIGKRC